MNTGTSGTLSGRNESISKRKINQKRQSSKQDQIVILGGQMPGRPGTTSNWKRNSKAFASVQDIQTMAK